MQNPQAEPAGFATRKEERKMKKRKVSNLEARQQRGTTQPEGPVGFYVYIIIFNCEERKGIIVKIL